MVLFVGKYNVSTTSELLPPVHVTIYTVLVDNYVADCNYEL